MYQGPGLNSQEAWSKLNIPGAWYERESEEGGQEKLRLDLDPEDAASWMQQVIYESSKAVMPVLMEHTHRWAQALR